MCIAAYVGTRRTCKARIRKNTFPYGMEEWVAGKGLDAGVWASVGQNTKAEREAG